MGRLIGCKASQTITGSRWGAGNLITSETSSEGSAAGSCRHVYFAIVGSLRASPRGRHPQQDPTSPHSARRSGEADGELAGVPTHHARASSGLSGLVKQTNFAGRTTSARASFFVTTDPA